MSETPNILIRTRFYPPKPNTKNVSLWATKRAFYTCNNSTYNVLDYLSRESATNKNLNENEKEIVAELEREVMPEKDILNYISQRPGSGGLFSKDGMLSKEQIQIEKEKMKKTDSIIWEGVISFENQYGKQNCNTQEQALTLMEKVMPSLLKHSHLDYENVQWLAGFHTNTDNYHIQFIMYEKEPQHYKKNGELSFSTKGQLAKHNFDNAKFCIEKELTFEKDVSFKKRSELRSSFSKALWTQKKEHLIGNDLQELSNLIPTTGRLGYDSKNMKEIKPLVNRITTKLIQNCPDIKLQYNDYKNYVIDRKTKLDEIYKNNNIKPNDKLKNYVNDRIDDLYNRLGNITIKTVQKMKAQAEKYKGTKTLNRNTKVYRNNKKLISLSKETSNFLSISAYHDECLKAVYDLKKKLEESEELEIQQAKLSKDIRG